MNRSGSFYVKVIDMEAVLLQINVYSNLDSKKASWTSSKAVQPQRRFSKFQIVSLNVTYSTENFKTFWVKLDFYIRFDLH